MDDTEIIDAEAREITALAVREERPATPSLFGTEDPVEVVTHAVRVADALKAVVVAKGLVKNIQGKEFPLVEAWQTLGAMLRLTPVCEWSRPIEGGWEARVAVVAADGRTVGAAEAQCTRSERLWSSRDDFALRSMAQTRATGKSLRSVLGFVMVLAGYQATPAEEMDGEERPRGPRAANDPPPTVTGMATDAQRRKFRALQHELKMSDDDAHKLMEHVTGKTSSRDLTTREAGAFIDALQEYADATL